MAAIYFDPEKASNLKFLSCSAMMVGCSRQRQLTDNPTMKVVRMSFR